MTAWYSVLCSGTWCTKRGLFWSQQLLLRLKQTNYAFTAVTVFTAATVCVLEHKTQECTVTGKCLLSKVLAVMRKKLSLGAKPLSSQTLWLRGSTCTVCSSFALLHCSDFTSASQSVCKVLTAATFCMFVHRAQHFVLERLLLWTVAG